MSQALSRVSSIRGSRTGGGSRVSQALGRGSRARGLGPDLASSPGHCVALPLLFSGAHYNSSGHKTIGSGLSLQKALKFKILNGVFAKHDHQPLGEDYRTGC